MTDDVSDDVTDDEPRRAAPASAGDADAVAPPSRALAILLAVVSAGCLVAACFSHRWLANRRAGDFGYSPLSYADCRWGCQTVSNFQIFDNASKIPFDEQRVGACVSDRRRSDVRRAAGRGGEPAARRRA